MPLRSRPTDVVPIEDRYLSLRALSKYACMSVRTLRNYVSRHENPIPHYRMDGMILVRQSEFDVWMEHFRAQRADTLDSMVDDVMEALR